MVPDAGASCTTYNLELGDREGTSPREQTGGAVGARGTDHDGRQFFGIFARSGARQLPITSCLDKGAAKWGGFQSKTKVDSRNQLPAEPSCGCRR